MRTYMVNKGYWAATAKCGHVGKHKYIPKVFAVRAKSAKEAALFARNLPRVKHHSKSAILEVEPISLEEYKALKEKNNQDPYLHCRSVQEQRLLIPDIEERVLQEEFEDEDTCKSIKTETRRQMFDKKVKIENPKKYIRFCPDTERLSCVLN